MVYIPVGLRLLLIVVALGIFFGMVYSSIKAKMEVRYAILWITWALVVLVIAIKPDIAEFFSTLIGFQSVTNFVLLVMTGILFVFNYYLFMKMSLMTKQIRNLNYELAVTKKELDDKERSNG